MHAAFILDKTLGYPELGSHLNLNLPFSSISVQNPN